MRYRKLYLLCSDGTMEEANDEVLKMLFVGFGGAERFHGKGGRWDTRCRTMEEHPGKSVVWVEDDGKLVIKENVFIPLVLSVTNEDYVTVQVYAAEHGIGDTRVKTLCREGRIPGAFKKAGSWFIPRLSPLPPDARYAGVEK